MSTETYDRVRAEMMAAGGGPVPLISEATAAVQRLEEQGVIRRAGTGATRAVLWVWAEDWSPKLMAAVRRAAASMTAREIAGATGMAIGSVLRIVPDCSQDCGRARDYHARAALIAELDAIIAHADAHPEVVDA